MSENIDPKLEEYNNFYELLGVRKDAEVEAVEKIGRQLLAEHHPDISDKENARELYKRINRATNVLSDRKQRQIYNSLGHQQYIERREEGGKMDLSEDAVKENKTFSDDVDISSNGDSNAAKSSETINEQGTGKQDEEYNADAGSGYGAIDDLKIGETPEERISSIYKQVWGVRTGFFAVLVGLVYYLQISYGSSFVSLLNTYGGVLESGSTELTVITTICVLTSIAVGITGIYAQKTLKSERSEVQEKREQIEEQRQRKEDRESSSGMNTSTTGNTMESWDTGEFNIQSGSSETGEQTYAEEKENKSLKFGFGGVIALLGLSVFSSVIGGSNVFVFIGSLFIETQTTIPWFPLGEGLSDIELLLNMAGMGFTIALLLVGGPLFIHGLAKSKWYKYFHQQKTSSVWKGEVIIGVVTTMLLSGVLFGSNLLYYTGASIEGGVVNKILVLNQGVTSTTLIIISLVMLVILGLLD